MRITGRLGMDLGKTCRLGVGLGETYNPKLRATQFDFDSGNFT